MNAKHAVMLLAGIAFATGLATQANAASEFQYSIPPGWRDLRAAVGPGPGDKNVDNIPPKLLIDAADNTFAVVAVEPQGTTSQRVGASFNAVEAPSSGRITLEEMEKYAPALKEHFKANGFTAIIWDTKVVKFNGVNVGMITFEAKDERENRTLVQYIIPGRKSAAVLTFSTPRADFNKYLPVFEASARATKGGFQTGFSYVRTFEFACWAALLAFSVGLMIKRRRGKAAGKPDDGGAPPANALAGTPPTPTPPQRKTSKYTWDCPGCGKPVPIRLEQCRCGTAKPT